MSGAQHQLGVADAELDDADVAALWAASGAAWLTDPSVGAPGELVRRVVGLVDALDRRGAELGSLVPARGVGLLAERAAMMGLPPGGAVSVVGATRFVRTRDGWLALSLARDDDLLLVPAWLETDATTVGTDDEAAWEAIAEAAAARSTGALVERAILLGLLCGAVGEPGEDAPAIAEAMGAADARPLADVLVVNLSALWAGPLCADVLARAGARLITVESTGRPDGGRQARRFFAALHGRSESAAFDLATRQGRRRLARLLGAADVVIEGSRPRALRQMGIDARSAVSAPGGPRVWLSITAHGRSGDTGHRVGFGDDAAAAGGLVGWVDRRPRFVADAVADPLTGLTAALATCQLLERGGRWLVDVALARTARSVRPEADGWGAVATDHPRTPPRQRSDAGAAMPLGRDTAVVVSEFGLDEPDP